MKIIALFLTIFAVSSFALPIVLEENVHRNAVADSVFTIRFESNLPFWQAHNFFVRTKIGGLVYDGDFNTRFIAYFGDSIGGQHLNFVASAFLDNKAVHGQMLDWVKPGKGHDTNERVSIDMYRIMLNFTPNEHILIGMGKDYYNWGPSQLGGLMLSDYNMGFVGLYQQYKLAGFTIRGLATQLSSSNWGARTTPTPEHRFFSAGRIEYYRERWGMALSQSMIYAGQNRSFEIPYLIPVFPYHYVQISSWRYGNNGENSAGGVDAYVNFLDKNLELYGEFFVDDIQGDTDERSQSVQNALAFVAGTKFNIPNIAYGFFEAGQINSFVYNHIAGYSMKFLNKDAFIASPLGPDNQLFWGKLGHDFKNIPLKAELYGWLLRQGERDINYNIKEEIGWFQGTRSHNIPFGNVKRETATWASAIYEHKHNTFELYGGVSVTETEKISGSKKANPFIGFSLNAAIGIGWDKK